MQVFTPADVTRHAANKYLGVRIAAEFSRLLNEFPRERSSKEKKLTTRALEALEAGTVEYTVVAKKRPAAAPAAE